jgi:lipopolysaccharide export system permease protein
MWDIARTRATAGLKPQVFNDEFPGLIIYAEQIDTTADQLERVLISDERDPQQQNTVFARPAT